MWGRPEDANNPRSRAGIAREAQKSDGGGSCARGGEDLRRGGVARSGEALLDLGERAPARWRASGQLQHAAGDRSCTADALQALDLR